MKKLFIIYLATVLSVLQLAAQVPQGINYQTVVRNGSGAIIPNQNVNFRLSIISGSPTGSIVYVEAQPVATNSLGLVNLIIGQGTPLSGTFSSINWGSASHYLSVELDPTGGTAFQPMGTSQLMSVPYALSAGNSTTSMAQLTDVTVTGVADGQTLKWNAAQSKWLPANDIGGGTGDNWGTQTVQADNTLTGNGTSATPLKIAQQGATTGQVLKWNGSTWLPDNDIGGGTGDNWGTQTVQTDNTLTGNGTSSTPLKLAQQSATNGQVLKWNGTAWLPSADINTDAQTLSLNGNSLSISGGNSVTLPSGGGSGWALTGNAGTSPSTNFIGTTDNQPLVLKVNNQQAGYVANSSGANVFLGYQAGNAGGCCATGIGHKALFSNTNGNNTAVGQLALYTNTSGDGNVAVGEQTLYSNTTANNNTAVGSSALYSNTTGVFNTAIGNQAMYYNTIGDRNTAIGLSAAGMNQTDISRSTFLGYLSQVSGSSLSNCIAIAGNGNIFPSASNTTRIGNSSMTSIGGQVSWTTVSDARTKSNITENIPGISFIKLLRPVSYNYNKDAEDKIIGFKDSSDYKAKYDIEKKRFSGFLAQEVDAAAKEIGYEFSGVDKSNSLWGLRYAEFTVPLVKAVQEQQALIEKLIKEIEYLKSKID